MKPMQITLQVLALLAAAFLVSVSQWPGWPATLSAEVWAWYHAHAQVGLWPMGLLFWFFCPDPNWIGGGCGYFTPAMIAVRLLAGAAILGTFGYTLYRLIKRKHTHARSS